MLKSVEIPPQYLKWPSQPWRSWPGHGWASFCHGLLDQHLASTILADLIFTYLHIVLEGKNPRVQSEISHWRDKRNLCDICAKSVPQGTWQSLVRAFSTSTAVLMKPCFTSVYFILFMRNGRCSEIYPVHPFADGLL